jgi:predicted small integral membrane protein
MLSKYPDQTKSRRAIAAVGAAFIALGIFLVVYDALGKGGVSVLVGGIFELIVFFTDQKGFERAERILSWFHGLS